MALPATGVWEIETTGVDTNGGLYDPSVTSPGQDYTQGAHQQAIAYTDLVIGATTTQATSVNRPGVANDVGNTIHIAPGGGFTGGWFNIRSVAAGVFTFDRSLGTTLSTGGTGTLGGAMASLGAVAAVYVGGNTIFQQQGTYTGTTASVNVAGGIASFNTQGSAIAPVTLVGYATNRVLGNTDTPPVLTTSVGLSGASLLLLNSIFQNVYNVIFDGSSQTATIGLGTQGAYSLIERCIFRNCTSGGCAIGIGLDSTAVEVIGCTATGNGTFGISLQGNTYGNICLGCEAYSNTGPGFNHSSQGYNSFVNCLSYGNTGASSDGFNLIGAGHGAFCIDCDSYSNGRHGFNCNASVGGLCQNCLSEGNSGVAFSVVAKNAFWMFLNCGAYNNTGGIWTSGATPAAWLTPGFITNTTGSFFVNAAAGNFALNNTVNQGALARAAGYPALYPRGLTAAYYDVGAAQSQASAGTSVALGIPTIASIGPGVY